MSELYHYGVLGMKWGVRKYQNSDGSLIEEGKKRYFNADGTLTKKGQKANTRFYKNLDKNWRKSYNQSINTFNKGINAINERHPKANLNDLSAKETKKYIDDMQKEWSSIYTRTLLKNHGESINLGKNYVEHMPYMNYVYDLFYDDEK